MFLRAGAVLFTAGVATGFEFNEKDAEVDIWVNQAMDCPGSQGANLTNWDCGLACQKAKLNDVVVLQDDKLDSYGIVGTRGNFFTGKSCVLALRGTKNIRNIISDVEIFTRNPWGDDCPRCQVHDGFYGAWSSLSEQAHEALSKLGCTNKKLRVTGHSLGASMAALAAFELAQSYQVDAVYMYGQPRTGNKHWVSAFEERMASVQYFRVTDYKDDIPHLILHDMFLQGWKHLSPEVYYDKTQLGAYTTCENSDQNQTCSSQWSVLESKDGGCFHCSYLGLNPCTCNDASPQCTAASLSSIV